MERGRPETASSLSPFQFDVKATKANFEIHLVYAGLPRFSRFTYLFRL